MTDYLTALKLSVNSSNYDTKKFINYCIACSRSEAIRIAYSHTNQSNGLGKRDSPGRRIEKYFRHFIK